MACSVEDCVSEARGRGFCNTHYSRWRRNGDPLKARPDFECDTCAGTFEATGPSQKRCKPCKSAREIEYNREWRRKNPGYHSEYNARWRERNPEACRAYALEYRMKNPEFVKATYERWAANNPDYARKWVAANRERARETVRRRRARVRNAPTFDVSERDIKRMLARHGGKCAYCSISLADGYHVDHVLPVSLGGSNSIGNLAPACATCNVSKSNYFLSEWRYRHRLSKPLKSRRQLAKS